MSEYLGNKINSILKLFFYEIQKKIFEDACDFASCQDWPFSSSLLSFYGPSVVVFSVISPLFYVYLNFFKEIMLDFYPYFTSVVKHVTKNICQEGHFITLE